MVRWYDSTIVHLEKLKIRKRGEIILYNYYLLYIL